MGRPSAPLALLAAAAVTLTGCSADTQSPRPVAATTAAGSPAVTDPVALESAYEKVIAGVLPSIVQINTESGLGSGVVYDTSGHIVTNAHVVGDARRFQVSLASGGAPRQARLVASFPLGDLAVIKVDDPSGLRPATFGDSSKLRVGQIVLAMGNPLGLGSSVTDGIVSALGRTVTEPSEAGSPGATITNAIQTSAAINPGNSGGALVNLAGEVIGIPTLAATVPELGGGAAPGIGFAIPSNTATDIAGQIVKSGEVTNTRRAALGVTVRTLAGPDGRPSGVGVVEVSPDGGAARAGIQPGDVIVSINGTEVPTTQALSELLATLDPGDEAKVEVLRSDGSTTTVTVTLGELSTDPPG
ncbi:S1C family serine protease [Planobispora takensis]|uniref:Protease n=1 Tax=Planobispora takensis TaxID=1367882 RepID=A0A8J3SUR6_9ACTN|nr:trypsin-like peptidase domain-containing protein [Planobispora takensis]GII01004.1 protease [Planobispora takensis]